MFFAKAFWVRIYNYRTKYVYFLSKIEEVPADKVEEFENSLNAFLAPYKDNAEATGYLFGDSITIGKFVNTKLAKNKSTVLKLSKA